MARAGGCGASITSINPATGAVLAEVRVDGPREIDAAVASAEQAQRSWGAMSGAARARVLRRAADILRARNRELAELETRDTGKPIQETIAVDIASGADCLEYFAGLAASLAGEHFDLGPQAFGYTRREPLGVVAGIGAWNYPLQIACWKAAPALACGNAMLFKPAELTPLYRDRTERGVCAGRSARRRVPGGAGLCRYRAAADPPCAHPQGVTDRGGRHRQSRHGRCRRDRSST